MSNSRQTPTLIQTHRLRLPRTAGWMAAACAGCILLLGVAQARAGTVVTDQVVSQSTQSQTSIPVTFGQVFKDGDVPAGSTVLATLNGQSVPLQVDTKATNPDGSLRHAVLTAVVPSLPGGGTLPLALSSGSPAASMAQGTPISLSQLLATNYNAQVSLNLGGTNYSVDARGLLQAASLSGVCAAWDSQCNLWLSGPLVSAWVVNGPLTSASGATNPNLRVYFAVRAYAGTTPGTVGYVRTDIIVENSNAFAPQAQPQYTATLTSGNASYTSPALTQYAYTRWHKVLWWNNAEPQVYLQQDTQYLQDSMAVSRYENLQPDQSFLNSVRQSCAPLDHCDQTQAMGTTGAQAAIGPLPRWTSVYIIYPDVRAYNWMLANTDALGAYSVHYRDAATGWPVSIQKHPYVTIANWGSASQSASHREDLLPNCVNNLVVSQCTNAWYGTGNPNSWDFAHQPAAAYVPYMVTGDYYYMSEIAFVASMNELHTNENYRGFDKGLLDAAVSQVRGKAWTLRNLANAAWLLPDDYPLKAEFNADVNNAIADFNATYTNNPNADALGLMNSGTMPYSLNGGNQNAIAPWQHNFLTWSVGHAAELGFAGAAAFRNWLAKFEISMMTDWQNNPTQGYCWLEASAYNVQVKDAAGNWLPNFTAVYAATFPTLVGLACNSPQMVGTMGQLAGQPWQEGEMPGYPDGATGFPANLQIGLASAADSGLPNATTAWTIFDARSVQPSGSNSYNDYPNFALVPRSTPQSTGPILPPTNPIPPPVNPPPPVSPPAPPATPPPVNPPPTVNPITPPSVNPPRTVNPVTPPSVNPPVTGNPPVSVNPVVPPVARLPLDGLGSWRLLGLDLEPAYRSAVRTMRYFAQMILPGALLNNPWTGTIPTRTSNTVHGAAAPAAASPANAAPPARSFFQPQPAAAQQEPVALPQNPTGSRAIMFFNDCSAASRNQPAQSRCALR